MADLTNNEFRGLSQEDLKVALQREARSIGISMPKEPCRGATAQTPFAPKPRRPSGRNPVESLLALVRLPLRIFSSRPEKSGYRRISAFKHYP